MTDALHVQTVSLTGTGLAPPEISYSPIAGLIFPTQTVGVASRPNTNGDQQRRSPDGQLELHDSRVDSPRLSGELLYHRHD